MSLPATCSAMAIGRRAPRVDEDDPGLRRRFAGEPLLLLRHRAALQIRHPVREEVVGLRLVRVAADRHDHVGQLRILVAVVELADAHLAGRVALGVVGGTVVDAHHRRLERREHELARAPGVLESAAGTAVIETVEDESARTVAVENLLGDAAVERQGVVPARVEPCVADVDAGVAQPLLADAVVGVHHLGELPAARRRQALVHRAALVGDDHDVVAPAVLVLDDVGHRRRHDRSRAAEAACGNRGPARSGAARGRPRRRRPTCRRGSRSRRCRSGR